jgi:peptidyl-prolyl cis-trans isomerase SurA
MKFSQLHQSTAVLILSAALSALPSLAQTTDAKPAGTAPATPPVTGKVVEDIVARVNDQIVTQSDYDRAAEQMDAEAKQQAVPAQQLQQKQADLLRDLIDQQLLISKGKELGITGETDLVKQLDELRKQNHLDSMEDLEKAYVEQAKAQGGGSFEDFKATMRNRIITQQVVRDEVGRHIAMSQTDVQKYFKDHESEFAQPESVTLNEIMIPTPAKSATEPADAADVEAAQAKADALVAKLAAGAKFEDLAKPAPADPNDPKSLTLGEFHRGQLAKEIEDKAFALNAGQYTQPIRTKQGFIILQVTQHNPGGEGSYKQVEPQVEEALFMERMQPALRQYLTSLRDEAYVEIKPGVVDTGASGNEMRLSYSAYTPPAEKKKKKFARARFRGKTRSASALPEVQTAASKPATAGTPAAAGATSSAGTTQQASNAGQKVMKPGKPEKIRFGQAPRESLPSSQSGATSAAVGPADSNAQTASVTTPEVRFVNPDGSVSSTAAEAPEKKTRLSNRPPVPKAKKAKKSDGTTPPQATADELATQKVQDAPLGLADPAAQSKKKPKGDKTRLADKPKEPEQTPQPYLGSQPAPTTSQPAPPANQPAPPASQPPAGTPGANQP